MKLLTPENISKILKVSKSTVYAWASQDMIPSYKINGSVRFEESEIFSWIQNSKINQKTKPNISHFKTKKVNINSIIESTIATVTESSYNTPQQGKQADFRVSGRRRDGNL